MRFPPEFLDEVRRRVSVVDVVSRKVKLVRKGREHMGLCPFHSEKTPSFTVNEDKGFYHCFGCGAHGDAFRFLTESEGVPFPEAVERLASEAGVEVPQLSAEEKEAYARRDTLYDVMQAAASWYESQLAASVGADARAYLEGREIKPQTVGDFRIGYAPDGRTALKDAMIARKVSEDQMVEAGLLIKPEDGSASFDRFRGRIIFPISDAQGRVIAFGGRAMNKDAKAKYLNSPETPLFHKGHNLYNLGPARKAAYEAGTVIVAEGYMDVIALYQGGFPHAVAPLGTALTEDQIGLLWRMAAEPILCFDGDKAGFRAAERALERALPKLRPGYSLQFALLPEGEDPDDLIRRAGSSAMQRVLSDGLSLVEMLWRTLTEGADISTPERRAGLEKKVFDALRPIEDEKIRKFYGTEFRDRVNQMFWQQRSAGRPQRKLGATARRGAPSGGKWRGPSRYEHQGRGAQTNDASMELKRTRLAQALGSDADLARMEELLCLSILNHPQLLVSHLEDFAGLRFGDPTLAAIHDSIVAYAEKGEGLDAGNLYAHLVGEGHEKTYLRLMGAEHGDWHVGAGAKLSDAETGFVHTLKRMEFICIQMREKQAAVDEVMRNFTEAGIKRISALREDLNATDANEPDIEGYGLASERRKTY